MTSCAPLRRIASHKLFTGTEFIDRPLVETTADGTILSVGQWDEGADRLPQTEFYAGILLPGLVDAHTHLELAHLRGRIDGGRGLAAFLGEVGARRADAPTEVRRRATEAALSRMEAEGTCAAGDHCNGDHSFEAKARSTLFFRNFAELFGSQEPRDTPVASLLRHPDTSLTPHSTYSLSEAAFRAVCRAGREPLSIHLLESGEEALFYQRRGPLYERYRRNGLVCDFLHHGSPVDRIIDCVPPDRPVLLVHACCIGERDARRLMEHFTAPVWWCLCPRSNEHVTGLRPPVGLLRRLGANLCVGTDSAASNRSASLVDELRALEGIPLAERLRWVTLGGASALGLSDRLGSIAPGRRPRLVLLSGVDMQRMELTERSRTQRIV